MSLPDHISHYYSRSDRPFLNLRDLGPDELTAVLEHLRQRKTRNPAYKRVFGGRYMAFRRRTEDKLRRLFVARGGKPERSSPHYFVLGECDWFAGLYPDPASVSLNWRSLDMEKASFTYPDSFVSMRLGPDFGLPADPPKPYQEKVFLLDELEQTVADYGLPDGAPDSDYLGYHRREFEKYIEVQLWSDQPVAGFLKDGACPV